MSQRPPRILVVDDDPAVLAAYRSMLLPLSVDADLVAARAALFGDEPTTATFVPELMLVDHGQAAIDAVAGATASGGFAMAFVDMRMPPGIDGIQTVEHLWTLDTDLQVVIASAYTDVPWLEIATRFGSTDRLLFLKKPFDAVEVRQMAVALCKKRQLLRASCSRERQLEQHVAARTQELAKALRLAEAAASSRLQFLANMSHEIRTPLTAILGFAEMLRQPSCGDVERSEHLAIIDRNSNHLLQLVNDVLDLSKLEAKQLLLEPVPTDVPALLAEIVSMMRPKAIEKGLQLGLDLNGMCPTLLVTDGTRVRQILFNLLGNAIKFTAHGTVRVGVGVKEHADGQRLEFEVKDSGIGIAADRVGALFEPFVQADASTSRRFGGTGLGLSICRRLATLLKGSVAVTSESGRGSAFTLSLPAGDLARGPWLRSFAQAVREPVVATTRSDAGPRLRGRILLAEDGVDNQRLLTTILRRAGADVVTAANGEEAVALVQQAGAMQQPFDLVLMDMQMPVMDGYSATRRLRALGNAVPIIALTAHAMDGDRERCLAEGCDGYETKPVRADRLVTTCQRFLGAIKPSSPGDDSAAKP